MFPVCKISKILIDYRIICDFFYIIYILLLTLLLFGDRQMIARSAEGGLPKQERYRMFFHLLCPYPFNALHKEREGSGSMLQPLLTRSTGLRPLFFTLSSPVFSALM